MNKNFLEHDMKTKPETMEQKYLFLVDNTDLAFAIICAGFPATTLLFDQQGYYDVNSFIAYMSEIACTGTSQPDYIYVPACFSKNTNDITYETCGKRMSHFFYRRYPEIQSKNIKNCFTTADHY